MKFAWFEYQILDAISTSCVLFVMYSQNHGSKKKEGFAV